MAYDVLYGCGFHCAVQKHVTGKGYCRIIGRGFQRELTMRRLRMRISMVSQCGFIDFLSVVSTLGYLLIFSPTVQTPVAHATASPISSEVLRNNVLFHAPHCLSNHALCIVMYILRQIAAMRSSCVIFALQASAALTCTRTSTVYTTVKKPLCVIRTLFC